jgi:hypothetical protein
MGHQLAIAVSPMCGSDAARMSDHPQLASAVLAGVMVDENIVSLVDYLNRCGWTTLYSCQGRAGRRPGETGCPYVMFADAADLGPATAALADLAQSAGDTPLAVRILGVRTAPLGPPEQRWIQAGEARWRYEVDWRFEPPWDRPAQLTATLRLGSDDLPLITTLIARTAAST